MAIPNDDISKLAEGISSLPRLERELLIIELFERGVIDFVRLATLYVEKLDKERKQNRGSIASLGLMLGAYCMTDTSRTGIAARKHLRESGMYGRNDGSKFGQMLDEEFGNK